MEYRIRPLTAAMAVVFSSTMIWQSAGAQTPPVMNDVVVTADRVTPLPVDTALAASQLAPLRAATSDTASLLRDIPGLSLYGAGGVSSLPAIHGMADDRLRIKVDDMDLISACGNHMNPPLSYIDPSSVARLQVFAGITPVSVGGDSIGGTIKVESAAPEFAADGQSLLTKGEVGGFYRSNGNVRGGNVAATLANEKLSISYRGATVEADNYRAGGKFKPAGPAFTASAQVPQASTNYLAGDEVGSSMYQSTNHLLGLALRHDNHLLELKLGFQDIPYQGFPNQRMDMTGNDSERGSLRFTSLHDWGKFQAQVYHEHTRHKMNFLDDKAYYYANNAQGMPMDTEGYNSGVVVKADIVLSERDLLRVGSEYQRYRFDDWWVASGTGGMSPNTFKSINDGQRDRYALFGEWEAGWTPQWLTLFGVRHETVQMDAGPVHGYNANYNGDANAFNASDRSRSDHNWDLTALARYTANRNQTVDFGYARKTRSANLYERFAWSTGGMAMNMINMVGDGNGYVGNLDLKPEVAHTLSATADWHDAERQRWGLRITPYVTYVENYINARRCAAGDTLMGSSRCAVAANQTLSNNFVFLKYDNQDARLYGIDISGHLPLAKNTGLGSFTANGLVNYVRGKTTSGKGDDLYNIMPLNAKLAVTHQLGNWNGSAELVVVDGKKDVSAERNELKTPGYGLFNLRGSYTWKQVRFDVGVDNVFDRLYYHPLGGAYVGQGTTMPPLHANSPYGISVPGMGRAFYAGVNLKF
jgi:iron complex outermembrane recepter protein